MNDKKTELDIDCSEMDFKIEPFGYGEKDNIACELKLYFQTNPDDMVKVLKAYKEINENLEDCYAEDEEGEPLYLADIWNLKLHFLRFEKR